MQIWRFSMKFGQNRLREFLESRTWQIYKKIINKNKRQMEGDWCFVINTAQLFWVNDRIWCPINSLERQSAILELTASAAFGKQNIILSNFIFYNLSIDI